MREKHNIIGITRIWTKDSSLVPQNKREINRATLRLHTKYLDVLIKFRQEGSFKNNNLRHLCTRMWNHCVREWFLYKRLYRYFILIILQNLKARAEICCFSEKYYWNWRRMRIFSYPKDDIKNYVIIEAIWIGPLESFRRQN